MLILRDNIVNPYNDKFQKLLSKFYPYCDHATESLDNESFLKGLDELYK